VIRCVRARVCRDKKTGALHMLMDDGRAHGASGYVCVLAQDA
jgi:hypothetical protein